MKEFFVLYFDICPPAADSFFRSPFIFRFFSFPVPHWETLFFVILHKRPLLHRKINRPLCCAKGTIYKQRVEKKLSAMRFPDFRQREAFRGVLLLRAVQQAFFYGFSVLKTDANSSAVMVSCSSRKSATACSSVRWRFRISVQRSYASARICWLSSSISAAIFSE